MFTLALTTSPAPWHPSTDITIQSIESKLKMLSGCPGTEVVISADGVAPYCTAEDRKHYEEYLGELYRIAHEREWTLLMSREFIGHAGTLAKCFENKVPWLICATEDDEIIKAPVPIDQIVGNLISPSPINCIRLVRYDPTVPRRGGGNYKVIKDLGTDYGGIPLLANRGWATSTHFATGEFYKTRILPNLDYNLSTSGDGRGGVERVIWTKYRHECRKRGEMEAWKDWGICMYWDGEVQLEHIGKSRKKWREQRTDKRQD